VIVEDLLIDPEFLNEDPLEDGISEVKLHLD